MCRDVTPGTSGNITTTTVIVIIIIIIIIIIMFFAFKTKSLESLGAVWEEGC